MQKKAFIYESYYSPVIRDKLQKLQNRRVQPELLLNYLLIRAQITFTPPSTGRGYLFGERNKNPLRPGSYVELYMSRT